MSACISDVVFLHWFLLQFIFLFALRLPLLRPRQPFLLSRMENKEVNQALSGLGYTACSCSSCCHLLSATMFLYRWPSCTFTRQCLKYWPAKKAKLPHVVTILFPQQSGEPHEHCGSLYVPEGYMREVNNSFGTWEKVQGEGNWVETLRSFPVFRTSSFSPGRQTVCLSVCGSVTRWKWGPPVSVLCSQTCKVMDRLINLSPSSPCGPVWRVSKQCWSYNVMARVIFYNHANSVLSD